MYNPVGLSAWEVVAASGLVAWAILGIASVIGFTLAWMTFAERRAARHPVARPVHFEPAAARPAPARAPEFASTNAA